MYIFHQNMPVCLNEKVICAFHIIFHATTLQIPALWPTDRGNRQMESDIVIINK